jgi:hypothetical protein
MISIFAKPTFFIGETGKEEDWTLHRVSSRIRGEEIAEYLGAKFNQERSDVNIYVKGFAHGRVKDGDYIDILDDDWTVGWLKDKPGIKVIAMSLAHYDWLKKELKNEIVYIPHHHVNFERVARTRKEITTCGYIGAPQNIKAEGFEFTDQRVYKTRQDIIDFYKKIDIQIIGDVPDVPYYHPTKIINAMSFGIPTVSPKKIAYREVDGFYFQNLEELKGGWDADRLIKEAEKYHISNIAKLYQQL